MSSVEADAEVGASGPKPLGEAGAAPEWRVLGRLAKTSIGSRGADGIARVRRRERPGCLLYGPYWQLPSGGYRLDFRCRSGQPRMPSQPVLAVEVIAMNRVQLTWLDLTAEQLQHETGSLEFSVPPPLGLGAGDEARLEFRFFHLGNADLAITAVDLSALPVEELSPAPARIWRMLGRLEKTMIGRGGAEGVTVRRSARAGCVLDGGLPLLQLPQGRYRISFRCAAGVPIMLEQPVLGVEVTAQRRWQHGSSSSWIRLLGRADGGKVQVAWRDFAVGQLESGSGSLEFTVPPELGLEGGQEVIFGLRFVHFGNASLAISAAEICRVEEKIAPVPPREWRLLGRLAKGRIGVRESDRVTVRQTEPAGLLLSGGRPDLQLPAGRYRLSFCCRPGAPRDPSRPVLEVEVIAGDQSLLRRGSAVQVRRGFTLPALAADWTSIDFDVPPELSCESGAQIRFEFRFRHLANADLVISAVNLNEFSSREECLSRSSSSSAAPKKINVLIVGNCQAQTVYEAFLRTGELNFRLDAKYHFVDLQQNLHELGRAELENSDVLLVQDIKDWERYPLRQHIRDDVRIVKFPLLHFASLWPFDHYNGPGDKEAYQREWPNLTFLYHDGLLARLRREIPNREQRLLAYRSLSIDGLINFVKLHDFEKRRLIAMDKQFGCQIGRFILDNFQRRRLFYTTNHPNGQIIAMLLQYLLNDLGIDPVFRPNASLDHLKRLQVPVHPKVARALGVKWAGESTKYLYDGEQITWETYVRRYIDHYG
jgi:Polysaccharide biosynthesis enzyme WcbI